MTKIINGDLIKMFENSDFDFIAHCCNCVGKWKGGIHLTLGTKYPELQDLAAISGELRYFGHTQRHWIKKEGEFTGQAIYNLYAQYHTGSSSNKFCSDSLLQDTFEIRLKMLDSSLREMLKQISSIEWINKLDKVGKPLIVGLPLVLSGLAADKKLKGNKTDLEYFKEYILPTIEDVLKDYPNVELTIVNYVK